MFASAQQPITGIPPLSSVAGGPFDTVNLANLDVHFTIPVFSRPGKGMPFSYSLTYDSLAWSPQSATGAMAWTPVTGWGWSVMTDAAIGYVTYNYIDTVTTCGSNNVEYEKWSNWVYHDPHGAPHSFPGYVLIYDDPGCGSGHSFTTATATDNSGYVLHLPTITSGENIVPTTITSKSGMTYSPPSQSQSGAGSVTDPFGNTITISSGGAITDTLGPPAALNISGTNPVIYSYTAPSGTAQVKVNYSTYMVATHFNVAGISDYHYPSGIATSLVSSITLPDQSHYTFTYEPTSGGAQGTVTGRIASVTLPSGGTITYTYGSANSMMADGSPATFTRNVSGGTWTYARALQPNQSNAQQTATTVTAPDGGTTNLNFSGIYETMRKVKSPTGTLLNYSYVCYNGDLNPNNDCLTATVTAPIKWTSRNDALNTDPTGGSPVWSGIQQTFDCNTTPTNCYGLVMQENDYNYATAGHHAVFRVVNTAYETPLCTNHNICDHPSSVQVTDGANQKSLVSYTYDNGLDTYGSLTSVSSWVSPTLNLVQGYSYNSNGTLATATDPNGTVTTYTYTSGSCNYAFPTSVAAQGLTTSYAYNCTGGVVTSVTDPNQTVVSTSYSDPDFWRPAYTRDALGYTTYYNYYGVNNFGTTAVTAVGQMESVMTFSNGNGGYSTTDVLTTSDGLGRPYLQQSREATGSGSWDTV